MKVLVYGVHSPEIVHEEIFHVLHQTLRDDPGRGWRWKCKNCVQSLSSYSLPIHQDYRIRATPFIRITESQTRRCIRTFIFFIHSYSIQILFLVRRLLVMVLLRKIIIFLNIHGPGHTQGCRDKSGPSSVQNINGHFASLVSAKYGGSIEQFKFEIQEIRIIY